MNRSGTECVGSTATGLRYAPHLLAQLEVRQHVPLERVAVRILPVVSPCKRNGVVYTPPFPRRG